MGGSADTSVSPGQRVRFATLAALCEALDCQPGDLLRWVAEDTAAREFALGNGGL